jgi:glycosyltransferase involved in cell wall biosynthesis
MTERTAVRHRSALAITWEQHRRTRELCSWLALPLHELSCSGPRLQRYWRLGVATVKLLRTERPKVVYVQNPSLMLTLIVIAVRPFAGGYRVLMDAHNEAVAPFAYNFWPVPPLSRLAIRAADITIVTNAALADQVKAIGGRPLVLPDRLPTSPVPPRTVAMSTPMRVMVVATYAADEPIAEIIEAARLLGNDFHFFITGRETKLPQEQRDRLPSNVKQTGFLSEHDYWALMADCHVMLDLTLKPNCLVCGAYEAMAAQRPMILTGNDATVDLFGNVAVFPASPSPQDIATSVQEARVRYSELAVTVSNEGVAFEKKWLENAERLTQIIATYCT